MEAFQGLLKEGKVRALGASNLAAWRIAVANTVAEKSRWTPYCVVQQRYTYLRPRHGADFGPQIFITHELEDYAVSSGIALVGYSVLLQGAYTRTEREIPAQFAGPDSDDRLACLKHVAAEVGYSPNQVVIAWTRQSRPSILPIIAGSKVAQLKENIEALNLVLSNEQMHRLTSAGNPEIKQAWLQPT
jgi:aryl-alcohol dehydrogenase-like predicted oxidoreductase